MPGLIDVKGLQEISRKFKLLDDTLPRTLREALNEAADIVVHDAKPKVPRLTGRAAGSIRVASTRTKTRVKGGGNRARWYPWIDFGGSRVGKGGGIATRRFYKEGRYLWKSFGEKRDQVTEAMEQAVTKAAQRAGLEVTRG